MERIDRNDSAREHDLGAGLRIILAWKWWIAGLSLAAMLAAGAAFILATPSYRAEARILIGPRAAGLIGLRAYLADPGGENAESSLAIGQVQLAASRDLARRAIKDLGIDSKPEFDPLARGLGPGLRALVFLGLKRDPARMSPQERILQSYEERLSVSAERQNKLVTIAFRSEDRLLAADAANRIADLFVEIRTNAAGAGERRPADARIVSRATAPGEPTYPPRALLAVFGLSATLVTALGTLTASTYFRPRPPMQAKTRSIEPQAAGPLPVLTNVENARIGGLAPATAISDQASMDPAREGSDIAARIMRQRRDSTSLCIIVEDRTAAKLHSALELGRNLCLSGSTIMIGLDAADIQDTEPLAPSKLAPGFADLVAGRASFAQAIRRDPASRLHYVPFQEGEPIDPTGAETVLETLTRTYDFVMLLAPPLDSDEIMTLLSQSINFMIVDGPAWRKCAAKRPPKEDLSENNAHAATRPENRLRFRAQPAAAAAVAVQPAERRRAVGLLKRRASPST